jgi:hypothetical protein
MLNLHPRTPDEPIPLNGFRGVPLHSRRRHGVDLIGPTDGFDQLGYPLMAVVVYGLLALMVISVGYKVFYELWRD